MTNSFPGTTSSLLWCLILWLSNMATMAQAQSPPQLNGRHFRITGLEEPGFLDMDDDASAPGGIRFSGYLIDMLQALARPERGNFTYTLYPPSGYGSLCSPRLVEDDDPNNDALSEQPTTVPYDAAYRTQYNCGASDVNDMAQAMHSTDWYLGMYYVTPSRLLQNHFTVPFVPPFSGTLAMFGTATGIASFGDLVRLQATGQQPAACAPAGTALIDFIPAAYPGLAVQGLYGGEEEILTAFQDGTCSIYITDGPIASQFVLRQALRDRCIANGRPIGVIGKPMEFGLSHYAIGVGRHVEPEVVNTLSYWITVLMSCNPLDPEGGCTDGNLATFYEGRGGDGTECGYVLFPSTSESLDAYILVLILLACVAFVIFLYSIWHKYRLARQRRHYRRRQKAAMALAQQEKQLNEYIAHEIRNPLSSAIAALNFVSTQTADPTFVPVAAHRATIKEDLTIMDNSLQFVNDLLRNMLDVHRAQDKAMRLNLGPTDLLRDVLEPVASILFMRGTKVAIQVSCEPSNLIVRSDRMRLKQICLNLAANSSKFVEQGYIKLTALVAKEKDKPDNVVIHVEDTGPGIPPQKRQQLFVKFQESLDVLNQGTGIGLSVCKNISELMGADLFLDEDFDSGVPGCVGTRFVLRLNQAPIDADIETGGAAESPVEGAVKLATDIEESNGGGASSATSSTAVASNGTSPESFPPNLSLLFVDDDTLLRRMFLRTVRTVVPPDWTIREAGDGETALRLVDDGERFDLIFMDHYMASHNKQLLGTDTIRALRSRNVESIICGLSANDKEEEFMQSGADAFILKPFPCHKDALRKALFTVLHSRDQVPAGMGQIVEGDEEAAMIP